MPLAFCNPARTVQLTPESALVQVVELPPPVTANFVPSREDAI